MITYKDISIIIPCKNEKSNIIETLDSIYLQKNIKDINIIISDNSDDNITIPLIKNNLEKYKDKLKIKIIKGGYPSLARANGAKSIKSDYILFLDADVQLLGKNFLTYVLTKIKYKNLNLLTVRFKTDKGYNIFYTIFNLFQKIGLLLNNVFAVGGFQLWDRLAYEKIGGYNPDLIFAEDYWISSKIKKKNFLIYKKVFAYTSARRFKSKSGFYMLKMLILSYLNRKNIEFFKKDHNYWK